MSNQEPRYCIIKSIDIQADQEQVFAALASQGAMRRWLHPTMAYDPRPGGAVRMEHHGYTLTGQVVELAHPERLAFTWNQTPPGYPEPTRFSIVVRPHPHGRGSRAFLTHDGFERLPDHLRDSEFATYVAGWGERQLVDLKALAEGGPAAGPVLTTSAVYGAQGSQALEIRMTTHVAAPHGRVWRAVSTQEGLRHWLGGDLDFEPAVGGRVVLRGQHGPNPFVFSGSVLELTAPQRLVFTWEATDTPFAVSSLLTVELQPEGTGTRVLLMHHGFERLPAVAHERFLDFAGGWDASELLRLQDYLDNDTAAAG